MRYLIRRCKMSRDVRTLSCADLAEALTDWGTKHDYHFDTLELKRSTALSYEVTTVVHKIGGMDKNE
jgi:hypothetical protein